MADAVAAPPAAGQPTSAVAPVTEAPPVEGQTPPNGAPPQEPQKPPEPKDRFSERFATLTKRERALVQKQQEITQKQQQELAALAREREALQQAQQQFESLRGQVVEWDGRIKQARSNPKEFLKALYGESWYDTLTKVQTDEPTPELQLQEVQTRALSEIEQVRAEQKKLREEQEAFKKRQEETERQRIAQENARAMQAFQQQTVDFLKANDAKYGLINLYGRADLVVDTIKKVYDETAKAGQPRVLSFDEAAAEVEAYLGEEVSRYEKWKAGRTKPAEPAKPTDAPPAAAPPTLKNDLASPSTPNQPPRRVDPEQERLRRALAAWEKNATQR